MEITKLKCDLCQSSYAIKHNLQKHLNTHVLHLKENVKSYESTTKTNTFMNTFTEMKKLEFGIKKCHKMHVGPETNLCEDIKVHEGIGTKVVTDKYVGDIIANDGSNTEKIKERCDRGFGIINDIMSILEELHIVSQLK